MRIRSVIFVRVGAATFTIGRTKGEEMKKLTLGFILVIMMVVAAACSSGYVTPAAPSANWKLLDAGWTILKSPITNKCYEIVLVSDYTNHFIPLGEVDCKHYTGD